MASEAALRSLRLRIEFNIEHLGGLLRFLDQSVLAAQKAQDDQLHSLDEALTNYYGDDLWTDADVEFAMGIYGEDPDHPNAPFLPFPDEYPRIVRNSFVFLSATLLEDELRRWCDAVAQARGLPLRTARRDAGVLDGLRAYLRAVGYWTVPVPLWQRCKDLFQFRNSIAHAGARLSLNRWPTVRDALRREPLVSTSARSPTTEGVLVFSAGYCAELVSLLSDFFAAVFRGSDAPPRS